MNKTKRKQSRKKLKIAIVGLGYVGLPLAIEFSKKYSVIGFDKSDSRINELINGYDRTLEISNKTLNSAKNLSFTPNKEKIKKCNVYIVTVPTPVDKFNNPDFSALIDASKVVGSLLKKNDTVIYESTVFPGATEEICVPLLAKESNMQYNRDFFCGYSPERINPGDTEHTLTKIIKVTSGSNDKTSYFVDELYRSIIPAGTYKVSSMAIAEAAKVIENIQRDVNIALVNELSMLFNKLDLNTSEILEAAKTKWNFLPFNPGLVGGHCIGVDPFYLTNKALEIGYHPEIILAGRRINDGMGKYIANCTIEQMTKAKINPVNSRVAIFGMTFKENCPDLRNTKVIEIMNSLSDYGCKVLVNDLMADKTEAKNIYNVDILDIDDINNVDIIILAVGHDFYKSIKIEKWENFFNNKGVFIDVKSIFDKKLFSNTNIHYWSL